MTIPASRWREHADKFRAFAEGYRKALETTTSEFWREIDERNLKNALETVAMAERFAAIAEEKESERDDAA